MFYENDRYPNATWITLNTEFILDIKLQCHIFPISVITFSGPSFPMNHPIHPVNLFASFTPRITFHFMIHGSPQHSTLADITPPSLLQTPCIMSEAFFFFTFFFFLRAFTAFKSLRAKSLWVIKSSTAARADSSRSWGLGQEGPWLLRGTLYLVEVLLIPAWPCVGWVTSFFLP